MVWLLLSSWAWRRVTPETGPLVFWVEGLGLRVEGLGLFGLGLRGLGFRV